MRHVHLADRPLVLVPLTLAGEANAPVACLVGTAPDSAQLLVVPQPRNRTLRFEFAASLAAVVVSYVDSFAGWLDVDGVTLADAPQVVVPNQAGVGFVRLLGRSTRLRRSYGEYAVPRPVPLLGRWLTFLAERAEYAGSSLLLPLTGALGQHWASGQSPLEDANLASLLGWIDPPAGMTGAEAALAAEDPQTWPPAGPATDPTFDTEVLAPLVRAYDTAGPPALAALEKALRSQLEPTWNLMWRGLGLLRSLPPGASVEARWAADRRAFGSYHAYVAQGGLPQSRLDTAVAAAQRLHRLERAQADYDVQRALDDPLVMAEHRLAGEAFVGTVVEVDADRVVMGGRRRVARPLVTVATDDDVRLPAGAVVTAVTRPKQDAAVSTIAPGRVVLELRTGMGTGVRPKAGSVPAVGEELCYSTLGSGFQPAPEFPSREDTPWTHGGPPPAWTTDDDDAAAEEWE